VVVIPAVALLGAARFAQQIERPPELAVLSRQFPMNRIC